MDANQLLYGRRQGPGPKERPVVSNETLSELVSGGVFDFLLDDGPTELTLSLENGGVYISCKPAYPEQGIGRGIIKRFFELYEEVGEEVGDKDIVISFSLKSGRGQYWLRARDYKAGRASDGDVIARERN